MKRGLICILLIALLTMAFPFHTSGAGKVDFNYPQDVSKEALADLEQALKTGDGQLTVNALVRYSIAQSGISQDNMPKIVDQIETVIKKEKQPHIRALLNYFEAIIYSSYCDRYGWGRNRSNPVEEMPTDVTEWDRNQFELKIIQLVEKSLTDLESLQRVPVNTLPKILVYNELGATYVPTLQEFLLMKDLELLDEMDAATPLCKTIKERWLKSTEGNVPAHIYALTHTGQYITKDVYTQYQDNEFCAELLKHISFYDRKERYETLKDYVKRFPASPFTPEIKNEITSIESMSVSLHYPGYRSSRDSIPVSMNVENTHSFKIVVYSVPESSLADDYYHFSLNGIKKVAEYPITVKGTIPFTENNIKTTLPPLPYGIYILCAENLYSGKEVKASSDMDAYSILRVSDMAMISIHRNDHKDKIGTVNITTGKPIPGVTIKYNNHDDVTGTMGVTNANGLVAVPETYSGPTKDKNVGYVFNGMELKAVKGDDQYASSIHYYRMDEHSVSSSSAEIYTDLGVYRPGETVRWAAIAYYTNNDGRIPLAERTVEVIFQDKNHKAIDTLRLETDAYGRVEGAFTVPKDRLNGQFSLRMSLLHDSGYPQQLAWKSVNVSEYKTPTFAITFPDARRSYVKNQPVKVTGKVETYSGMPVANTQVRLSLIQRQWSWWWWRVSNKDGEHLMDTTVTTDAQGQFTFSYEPALFDENSSSHGWCRNNYQVVATVTNNAGETHEESTTFIVGTRRGIELGSVNKDVYLNDKPIKLPLKYNTTDEEHPIAYCTWEVTPKGGKEPVKTGNLNTADPTIDLTDLPSGEYTIKVHILDAEEGEQDVDVTGNLTLYRKTDREAPVKDCPLWISPLSGDVDKTNTGHITVGVSVPRAYIYYVASSSDKVIAEGWLNYTRGLHDLTIALPKEAGANVSVQFTTYYNTRSWFNHMTLINPYKAEALNISATSFRDKLAPGDVERWTFSLTDQNGKPHRGAMLLDMYDKAIASIAPNKWSWDNWSSNSIAASLRNQGISDNRSTNTSATGNMLDIDERTIARIPYLFTYDTHLFSYRMGRREEIEYRALGAAPRIMMKNAATHEAMEMESAMMDMTMSEAQEAPAAEPKVDEQNLEKVTLREQDVKTALWQPMLTSDDKGNIQLEFEVPNFNTTWITQAVAWDQKIVGSTWMAEVLTQKPLMVRSSMPRFLRQGDKAKLAATVQNATDAAAKCDAVIELFDPRSGDIYATRKFNLELDPMGSQAVNIAWTVPDTISFVGFRIKAANGRYGDGEQVMVPVLTTISPVIETEPFYIEAAQNHFETQLPNFPSDARVTLEYCDNPVWYCVLALPTIFSDTYSTSTQAAHSLFALQLAQVVAKSQPQIKEAITYWMEHDQDSVLVSMLEKNQDLKIGTLLASPWVREAERQTLRMSKLHELFDDAIAKSEYEKIITALQSLQMADGGFTWFLHPDCKSSLWTTGSVLEIIGEIQRLGGMPEDSRVTSMVNRALNYYDSESVTLFEEIKKHSGNPYASFTGYAYTRSLFPEVKQSKASADLLKKTVKYMNKTWSKGLKLKDKAWYAMTLYRNGYQKTARDIIESIRQFSIVKPNLGMYWDNLQTGYDWWEYDKVAYTSTILQAMHEIDPRTEELDLVRKWMLLMKQSNDWGSYSLAADAVYSILSTGSMWLERNPMPSITIAGEHINLDKMAEWLGYFRTTLPATTTGSVVIDRTGKSPAWGAVYSQYPAPMTQIQEKAIDEVSISKEYYVYAPDGSLHTATSFKVGDKVKVRLVIKANKDMDFVTITDERAACFEPVDQLSGYRSEDRTWFYQETKDTQTNVFINSLSKGTHIIGYDVWVTNPGDFTSGIATVQCQYAPQLSAHSAGKMIMVTGE